MATPTIASLIGLRNAAEVTGDMLIAGSAIFFYDWVLTFVDEIRDIWWSKFSAVKILFIANRIGTSFAIILFMLLVVGDRTKALGAACGHLFILSGITSTSLFCLWNWILAIRLHAIYGLNQQVKYLLGGLWVVCSTTSIALLIHEEIRLIPNVLSALDLGICTPTILPSHYFVVWIPGMIFEFIVFNMSVFKLIQMRRQSSASLYALLLRDGTMYYFVLTILEVTNLIMFANADPSKLFIPLFLTLGLGSTLISRMVLNLRGWNRVVAEYSNNSMYIVGRDQNYESRGAAYHDAQVILAGAGARGSNPRRDAASDIIVIDRRRRSSDDDLEGAVELELDVIASRTGGTPYSPTGVMVEREVVTTVEGSGRGDQNYHIRSL